ncbi:MAG: putative cell division protein [Erysipelotrichaceae bacterium]|nr:MAG: putative cell division protein [Erysipelotrichaceae bacterium]
MNDQNIYAALELTDHEIRLVVGQFHNQRLTVMKVERVVSGGILNQNIVDQNAIVNALKKAIDNASKNIGFPIKAVILALPSASMHRFNQKVNMQVKDRVTSIDIQNAVRKAIKTPLPEHLEIVNVIINKCIVNGISLRRLPIDETCDSFIADVDLMCADKSLVYQYASIVEKAGLEITEISLDGFAIGKEASLFEKSLDHYIVLMKIERQSTALSLFAKGKLMSTEVIKEGTAQMIQAISEKHHLPIEVADRLLHHNIRIGLHKYPKSPIYLWTADEKNHTLTENDVAGLIEPQLDVWLQSIHKAISPILMDTHVEIVLSGESADINGLSEAVARQLGCPTTVYISETLGIRNSALSVCAGLFYVLKDQSVYRNYQSAIEMDQFSVKIKASMGKSNPEDTLGNKFKTMFEKGKN